MIQAAVGYFLAARTGDDLFATKRAPSVLARPIGKKYS
jgi:hypothetical protein